MAEGMESESILYLLLRVCISVYNMPHPELNIKKKSCYGMIIHTPFFVKVVIYMVLFHAI